MKLHLSLNIDIASLFYSIGRTMIGHFRVAVNLITKARLTAKLFTWKLVCLRMNENSFRYKSFAQSLAFIMRFKATQKWPNPHPGNTTRYTIDSASQGQQNDSLSNILTSTNKERKETLPPPIGPAPEGTARGRGVGG